MLKNPTEALLKMPAASVPCPGYEQGPAALAGCWWSPKAPTLARAALAAPAPPPQALSPPHPAAPARPGAPPLPPPPSRHRPRPPGARRRPRAGGAGAGARPRRPPWPPPTAQPRPPPRRHKGPGTARNGSDRRLGPGADPKRRPQSCQLPGPVPQWGVEGVWGGVWTLGFAATPDRNAELLSPSCSRVFS